jgi:hypothetical protein
MASAELKNFFRAKTGKPAAKINWEKKKAEWIKSIHFLYDMVTKDFLGDLLKDGSVHAAQSEIDICEEFLGQYRVPKLILQVGDERVEFLPKGRNIVGAAGRVDLIGEMGQYTLVVQPKDRWGIVLSRVPTLKVSPLTEETLFEALKGIMRR